MPDKQSKEKMDILRAMGAEVVVTPTNVAADDPRSYYSVAQDLNNKIPNSFYPNQYDNMSNTEAHYETTGPEIWEQTDGKIDHLVVGVGTGGTISGTARYLKEKNPNIKIWGIDTYGSIFKKYHETGEFDESEIYSYLTEGIGEDILPENVKFDLIDQFEKVTDKDGMLMTRRLAKEEGIFVGNSAGSAMAGLLQLKDQFKKDEVVVIIFHDHGSRYVGKIFNDDWMRDRGFLIEEKPLAKDIIRSHGDKKLITVESEDSIASAIEKMSAYNISQVPVRDNGAFVGSLDENTVYRKLMDEPHVSDSTVNEIMQPAFPVLSEESDLDEISSKINKEIKAVIVERKDGSHHIVTMHDIIDALK